MSQNQLAGKSGVGRTGIIMFEQNERIPSALILKRLAQGLEQALGSLVAEAEGRVGSKDHRR